MDVVCQASDFFNAACKGNFKEADGVVDLPEQDPEVFKYFIHWLYTGKIRGYYYPPSIKPTFEDLKIAVNKELEFRNLSDLHELEDDNPHGLALNLANYRDVPFHTAIALYILADVLQVHGLKDQVVTTLVDIYGYTDLKNRTGTTLFFWTAETNLVFRKPEWLLGPTKGINMAWKMLPKGCNLRRLLVVLFCDNSWSFGNQDDGESFEPEFKDEAFRVMAGRWFDGRGTTDWLGGNICKLHDHDVVCLLPSADSFKGTIFPDHEYLD